MKRRDISEAQYLAAMKRHGFIRKFGPLGYWELPVERRTHVSEFNGGNTRRGRLAYMLRQLELERKRDRQK